MATQTKEHVVFINIAATGHMNPTLPLAVEFLKRQICVSYFVPDKAGVVDVVKSTGATWYPMEDPMQMSEEMIEKYMPGAPEEDTRFPASTLPAAASILPKLLETLHELVPPPSVILYDAFLPFARVAARQLGIPAISTVTLAGPGVIQVPPEVQQAWEKLPGVQKACQEIKDSYEFDVFQHGGFMEFYSPEQNIVCTTDSFFVGPTTELQCKRFPDFPWTCVGPLLNPAAKRIHNANVTAEAPKLPAKVDAALADGKRLLYVSPGTVATGHFWTEQFGPQAARNGLMDCTGKEFVQLLFRTCIDAFGNDPEIQVVMSTGGKEDALEGMTLPENFLALDVVPQLELLPKCHAFITHGGANSVHEALSFGIPLAVVPIFGDQPINADMVAKSGAGVSYRYPRDTLTVQDLKEVVNKMMRPGRFQDKAQEMKKELAATGGVSKAADVVLETIKKWSSKLGGA
eukprot:symbB.v1.2.039020.t1/scaffold6296.1/size19252/2